ncbi:MAG: sulfite exporter TauE/SafE family protein, partial [Cocleimonas sp.]|nr:sulfite exporter TauE/SafE family protein [Cocleimonas sp.]
MDIVWIDNSPYLIAFITGLVGGIHCIGMCGGIVGMLSLGQQPSVKKPSFFTHLPLLLGYNFGRIVGYISAGALIGALGASLLSLAELNQAKQILSIIAAIFMLLLGLYLAGLWNGLTKVEALGANLWKLIEPFSRRFIPVNTVARAIPLGFIWGWLPCGLVYTILIMALSAGSALEGALLMFAFGLGTLPNLLA